MSGRDANQLAADVRAYLLKQTCSQEHHDALAALRELVGLVGTLQQERDDVLALELTHARIAVERAEAAEAALADSHLIATHWKNNYDESQAALATTRQALTETLEAAAPLVAPDIELTQAEWNSVMSELRACVWRHTHPEAVL